MSSGTLSIPHPDLCDPKALELLAPSKPRRPLCYANDLSLQESLYGGPMEDLATDEIPERGKRPSILLPDLNDVTGLVKDLAPTSLPLGLQRMSDAIPSSLPTSVPGRAIR